MRLLLILICSALSSIAHAQVFVDGRKVAYDSLTNTMLASVPREYFNQSKQLAVTLQGPWQSCSIDDTAVTDSHLFSDIEGLKPYQLLLTDTLGNTIERRLEFTFLPIIELHGDFSNDYLHTQVLFTDPEAPQTDTLQGRVKWRGGTTNTPDKHKRNYKLKLDADTTLLGMRNDDSWILDAGQPDVFRLRNRIAMDVWNRIATPPYYADREPKARNGISGRVAEVFLNDAYNGFYNLSEAMDRKQLKLKKVDQQTGQIRGCLYKGVTWSKTQMFDSLLVFDNTMETLYGFEVKYPDLQDSDTTDWRPLVEAVNYAIGCSDEEFSQHIGEYYDLPRIGDYNIFLGVVNAADNSGKNTYWAVYNKQEDHRLTPAAWDLDCTFGQRWGGILAGGEEDVTSADYKMDPDLFINYRLFKQKDQKFIDYINQRYQNLRKDGILHTDSLTGLVTHYYQTIRQSGAARRETVRWSEDSDVKGEAIDFDKEYDYICQWIAHHMQIIDESTFPLYYNDELFGRQTEDISSPTAHRPSYNVVYDLQGRQLPDSKLSNRQLRKGLYIRNGRKYIVK